MESDASDFALVLQDGHPIAYESRKLKDGCGEEKPERKKCLQWYTRAWRQYVLGSQFVVKTDNRKICHFFSQPKLTSKEARWQECLAEFSLKFEDR